MKGPYVDIHVGTDAKHYSFPKSFLCYWSAYFDRCFNGGFAEEQSQKLNPPEDKAEDFHSLFNYLLTKNISADHLAASGNARETVNSCLAFLLYAKSTTWALRLPISCSSI